MMGEFVRTIGPGADVKEMEYINALQQTCLPDLRRNCTLSSQDIQLYLKSRYGIAVSKHIIKTNIIHQLGGQEEDYEQFINDAKEEESTSLASPQPKSEGYYEPTSSSTTKQNDTTNKNDELVSSSDDVDRRKVMLNSMTKSHSAHNVSNHSSNNISSSRSVGSAPKSQRELLLEKAKSVSTPNIVSHNDNNDEFSGTTTATTLTTLPVAGGSIQLHLPNALHRYIHKTYYDANNNDENDESEEEEEEDEKYSSRVVPSKSTGGVVLPQGNDDEGEQSTNVDDVVENPSKKAAKKKKKKKEPFVEEYLDLAQLMSILMIPSLLRSAYDLLGKERLRGRYFRHDRHSTTSINDNDNDNHHSNNNNNNNPHGITTSNTHDGGNENDDNVNVDNNNHTETIKNSKQHSHHQHHGSSTYSSNDEDDNDEVQLPPTLMRDMVRWIIWGLQESDSSSSRRSSSTAAATNLNGTKNGEGEDFKNNNDDNSLELYVTKRHIQQLLHLCGEHERASSDELVTQMLHCLALRAPSTNSSNNSNNEEEKDEKDDEWFVLNEVTLAYALTNDVALWDADWDHRFSTYYYDVFDCVIGNRPYHRILKEATKAKASAASKQEQPLKEHDPEAPSVVNKNDDDDDVMPDNTSSSSTMLIASLVEKQMVAQERLLISQGNKVRVDYTDFHIGRRRTTKEKHQTKQELQKPKVIESNNNTKAAVEGTAQVNETTKMTELVGDGGTGDGSTSDAVVGPSAGMLPSSEQQQEGKRMLSVISEGEESRMDDASSSFVSTTHHDSITSSTKLSTSITKQTSDPIRLHQSNDNNKSKPTKWKFTQTLYTGCIDFVTDTQWSPIYLVVAWLVFVMSVAVYGILVQAAQVGQITCRNPRTFGCTLGKTIVSWLATALIFMLAGLFVFLPLSVGNSAFRRRFNQSLISLLFAAAICIPPFAVTVRYWWDRPDGSSDTPRSSPTVYDDAMDQFFFAATLFIAFSCGLLLIVCMMIQIGASASYLKWGDKGKRLINWWTSTNDTQASYHAKCSANHKLNQMISNAHLLHFVSISNGTNDNIDDDKNGTVTSEKHAHQQVMLNYNLWGEAEEYVGGLVWTWKRILNKTLFKREGYWIHSRLYIGQCIQFVAAIFYSYFMIGATTQLSERAQGWRNAIESYDNNTRRFNITNTRFGHLAQRLNTTQGAPEQLPQWVFDVVPEPWMIRRSFYPASGVAILIMICLMLVYLPTTASTVLKLRCGVLPSMRDPHFMKYRLSADTVAYNLGNTFYALIGSATMFFSIFGIVIFASLWPFTKPIMTLIYAWLIGLFITIFAKVALMIIFRSNFHRGFYRSNPNGANIAGLMLECWHVGVAGGVLVSRLTQFLLATAFWIGRIDVPFLMDDVRIFGYRFDTTPSNYRKDVLVHEAHRHPYIERLGAMYLMKLKYGDRFGKRANACWRTIFVLVLMPWYSKYRVIQSRHRRSNETSTSGGEQTLYSDLLASTSVHGGDGDGSRHGGRHHSNNDDNNRERASIHDSLTALDKVIESVSEGLTAVAMEFIDEWPMQQPTTKNTKRA